MFLDICAHSTALKTEGVAPRVLPAPPVASWPGLLPALAPDTLELSHFLPQSLHLYIEMVIINLPQGYGGVGAKIRLIKCLGH